LRDPVARDIARQLVRSAWSVASNTRVTKHARSNADFISKMSVVAEEAEESAMWFEALRDLGVLQADVVAPLHGEARELTAIAVASIKTARNASRWRVRSIVYLAIGSAIAHLLPISYSLFSIRYSLFPIFYCFTTGKLTKLPAEAPRKIRIVAR
jgi:four helix bundle protein